MKRKKACVFGIKQRGDCWICKRGILSYEEWQKDGVWDAEKGEDPDLVHTACRRVLDANHWIWKSKAKYDLIMYGLERCKSLAEAYEMLRYEDRKTVAWFLRRYHKFLANRFMLDSVLLIETNKCQRLEKAYLERAECALIGDVDCKGV